MCGLTCFRQVGTELMHIRSSNIQEPNRVLEVVLGYSLMLKYSQFSFHRPASTDRRSRLDHALQVTIFLCSPKFRRIWMVPMVTYRDHLGSELFYPLLPWHAGRWQHRVSHFWQRDHITRTGLYACT